MNNSNIVNISAEKVEIGNINPSAENSNNTAQAILLITKALCTSINEVKIPSYNRILDTELKAVNPKNDEIGNLLKKLKDQLSQDCIYRLSSFLVYVLSINPTMDYPAALVTNISNNKYSKKESYADGFLLACNYLKYNLTADSFTRLTFVFFQHALWKNLPSLDPASQFASSDDFLISTSRAMSPINIKIPAAFFLPIMHEATHEAYLTMTGMRNGQFSHYFNKKINSEFEQEITSIQEKLSLSSALVSHSHSNLVHENISGTKGNIDSDSIATNFSPSITKTNKI